MSNYTKTAIINPASSSLGATVQISRVEKLRMQQRADDVSSSIVCPHTLIRLLVFLKSHNVKEKSSSGFPIIQARLAGVAMLFDFFFNYILGALHVLTVCVLYKPKNQAVV